MRRRRGRWARYNASVPAVFRAATTGAVVLEAVAGGNGSANGNKKAGEYSEEDTHRPAHHYREVVARRTVGEVTGQTAIITLEKETL